VRTTAQEQLRPTQERELERVLGRCRTLYNTALAQRITLWKQRGVSISRYQQEAELKTLRAEMPEYGALHSHVVQEVLARLDKTYHAFFRRGAKGEQPGFPRFHGKDRYHSFPSKEYGNGARLDNGYLALAKIGRIAVRWSRPVEGTVKTVTVSKEADGWYVSFSCAEVPAEPLPLTGNETGIDVGLKVFLITAEGDPTENPRYSRKAERALKKAQQRVARRKKGSKRRRKAVALCAKKHQHVRSQRRDFHHKTALTLARHYDVIYRDLCRGYPTQQSEPPSCPKAGRERPLRPHWGQPQSRPQQEYSRRWMAPLPLDPRLQGSVRRQARGSGQSSVYLAGVFRLWGAHAASLERAHPRLHELRAHPGPRRERGQNHALAWTTPSGTRGDTCGVEPRTRWAVAHAECQRCSTGRREDRRPLAQVTAPHPLG
jgi:putative transposase